MDRQTMRHIFRQTDREMELWRKKIQKVKEK
jgi:hypothetical protein